MIVRHYLWGPSETVLFFFLQGSRRCQLPPPQTSALRSYHLLNIKCLRLTSVPGAVFHTVNKTAAFFLAFYISYFFSSHIVLHDRLLSLFSYYSSLLQLGTQAHWHWHFHEYFFLWCTSIDLSWLQKNWYLPLVASLHSKLLNILNLTRWILLAEDM